MTEGKFKETNVGFIPENWELSPLTELIAHYVDNRGKTAPTSESGMPLIATNCIKERGLYPTYEKLRFVSKETYETWFRDHPQPNDIIIVNKGTPGLVCLVPDPVDFCIAQDMIAIRADENKIYDKYLFAYMRTENFKYQVQNLNVGTTIPHLKKTVFSNLIIPLPSYKEQKFIGDLYYYLSEKIELNQKMNQTLEEIGQALFKYWFVHFEFPNEERKPYKSSGGEMVDSELGEIPKGWEVKSLDKIANYLNGLALQKFPPENNDYLPVIKIRELKQGVTTASDKASSKIDPNYIIDDGDVIFSWSGSLEVVLWCGGIGALNQHLFKVSSGKYPKWFYYYWTKYHLETFRQTAADKTTTMGHIKRKDLSDALVVVPTNEIFSELIIMTHLIDLIINNKIESRNLSKIRDSILPKLMSGKIRVV